MPLPSRKPAEAAPGRMGPLAKLPVFLDLAGKRAVVAGGSAAAAWKAELMLAAGARVEVLASELEPEMAQLLARPEHAQRLAHRPRAWRASDLDGAAVALADIDNLAEAAAFAETARAAGALLNVVDKPDFCDFQLGSIVNRSPVVVAISTDGAAPILAQAIRRRIETLLPPALAHWGALARELRDAVAVRLERGAPRRRFWEAFAERAFAGPPAAGQRESLEDLICALRRDGVGPRGRVTLVGAGPGDAEMLTLKAVRALQSADVILFDDLVSEEVLELARREAKRMLVGKRGQRASCTQSDINALMLKLATQDKHVVRLKSGDPMIFGRAGEEIAELERHGIAVTVVPGITAALAAASALGVSLTHREHAHSVRLVTGHSRGGELPTDLDWRGLADPATTLVFYMGRRTAPAIAERLIAEGLPPGTPAVMLAGVTRVDEGRWHGTLAGLGDGEGLGETGLPVLIGVGRAFDHTRVGCDASSTVDMRPHGEHAIGGRR